MPGSPRAHSWGYFSLVESTSAIEDMRSAAELDESSLALHRLVVLKISSDRPRHRCSLIAALDPSERGNALRSASPFAGVLAESKGLSFLEAWSADRQTPRSAATALKVEQDPKHS